MLDNQTFAEILSKDTASDDNVPMLASEICSALICYKSESGNPIESMETRINAIGLALSIFSDFVLIDEAGLEGKKDLIRGICDMAMDNLTCYFNNRIKNNKIGH